MGVNSDDVTQGAREAVSDYMKHHGGGQDIEQGARQGVSEFISRNGTELYGDIQHAIQRGIEHWMDQNKDDVLAAIREGAAGKR